MFRQNFCFLFTFLSYLSIGYSFVLLSTAPRRVVKVLKVSNGAWWGQWGPPQFCAEGTYAVGYAMKIEGGQGRGDDTSLNAISLFCMGLDDVRFGGKITSIQGIWGHWHSNVSCHKVEGTPTFLTAFDLQVERDLGGGDDTGANYVKFKCRDFAAATTPYELAAPPGHGLYGRTGSWSDTCPQNSAICGLRTRVERPLDHGDDTALDNVEFYCCEENMEAGK
ncbi:vitelline membrane outer layer protein 1-like [Mercenaria mercenaria]|uniref:vitelline membrane outer layer protein 1-like n=1 Tax=Mercenaria mercenaria TaxID=6596 RepID=UPI00234EA171|nr:vitelline membrane outer layer protein 1-like [Mercenaria mercenaria]